MNTQDIQISLEKQGIIEDIPDYRDHEIPSGGVDDDLPAKIDNRPDQSPIKNQYKRGTCTSFAVVAASEYYNSKEYNTTLDLSEEYVYDWCKDLDNYKGYGTYLRTAVRVIVNKGACLETTMPYQPAAAEKIYETEQRPEGSAQEALKYKMKKYVALKNEVLSIKRAIRDYGVVFGGFLLYQNFGEAVKNGGKFTIPDPITKKFGHAMLFVGYDDDQEHFILKNSWGLTGDKGYYYVPYSYIGYPHTFSMWAFVDQIEPMDKPFTDIPDNIMPWAGEALTALKDKGFLHGTGDGKLNMSEEGIRQLVVLYRILISTGVIK